MIKLGKNEKLRSELSQKALVRSKDFSWKNTAVSLLQYRKNQFQKHLPGIFRKILKFQQGEH